MKEAVIGKGPKVSIIDSPIPKPGPHQVLIKVVLSGSNPKDWKVPEWMQDAAPMNQGDDIAGTIHALGEGVEEFKVGDRVAAFHEMLSPHGSYGEYAVSWVWSDVKCLSHGPLTSSSRTTQHSSCQIRPALRVSRCHKTTRRLD